MSSAAIQWLGWLATAVFVGSYFFTKPSLLRGAQMGGALLWMTYGALIRSTPVVVANVLVFAAAAWTMFRAVTTTRTATPHDPARRSPRSDDPARAPGSEPCRSP